ncbi:unnamed protein product [Adineta steineri]|uniref:Uncharacterized protein n=1 Tax=Adineta steineri TaxID=433720 RepID=A0A819K3F5_9BILA|nr:unnamed protein product [Adineta steineri]
MDIDKHKSLPSKHLDLQDGLSEKKKKKCRGNRKAQHLRRRMRRQQQKMDQDTTIVQNENDNLNDGQESILYYSLNKRKRPNSNRDDVHMSQSFSELSISQINTKKKKSISKNNKKDKDDNDVSASIHSIQRFKPHYLRVSDNVFKQMLSNVINDDHKTIQSIDTNEKIRFLREMTELTNNLYYFDLQRQLWQEYHNMTLKENGVLGLRQLSKSDAKEHNTCYMCGFPKHVIQKRQNTIVHQMQRTINELNQYLIQLNTWTTQYQPPIDPNILSNAINEFVKKGQERLKQEFDHKKKMLELNSYDHHLINRVYELQPTEEQLHLAKMIWQVTADELKIKEKQEILRKQIFLQQLPVNIDNIIDQSIDHVQPMLSNPLLEKDRRAGLISRYSKTITQYKFDLMTLNLTTFQTIIYGHEQILIGLQEKLLKSCIESLKQAIENRQEAMKKRHEIYLKHKLNTFFDEALATTVSNE